MSRTEVSFLFLILIWQLVAQIHVLISWGDEPTIALWSVHQSAKCRQPGRCLQRFSFFRIPFSIPDEESQKMMEEPRTRTNNLPNF